MESRAGRNGLDAPMSIYELHLGSWRRKNGQLPNYREVAPELADYMLRMGFTHVELMPVTEHPFYGSWGYQTTGYFAASARYGTPQDLMYFVDHLHQKGIGVILDWVPSHFPTDAHGLIYFDGTHLYEHADARQGFHPEWNSAIFNYGRNEVRSFLSSALFWLKHYHIDGLRVDAVASMLYLDYARKQGEWIPNRFGGRENLEAIEFLRVLNRRSIAIIPMCTMIAEESTAWPMVSRPTVHGRPRIRPEMEHGLDARHAQIHAAKIRFTARYHHDQLTFSLLYAFHENFVLPLSHDEVVHGKGSLIGKMPGDGWQQFANLRALYGYMWGHPGKKLLFMGGEFGAAARMDVTKGNSNGGSPALPEHAGVQRWVSDLNRVYRSEPALHRIDFSPDGFEWLDADNAERA